MTTICISCGLDVDETGRLYVPRAGGGDEAAFPPSATGTDNALQCDPDAGLFALEHFSDASRTAKYFTVNTAYDASDGSQVVGGPTNAWLGSSMQSSPARVTYCLWTVTAIADIVNSGADYDCVMEAALGHDAEGTFPGTLANASWQVGGNAISGRTRWSGTHGVTQDGNGGVLGSDPQTVPGVPLAAGADDLMLNIRLRLDFRSSAGGVLVNTVEFHISKLQVTDGAASRAAGGAVIA